MPSREQVADRLAAHEWDMSGPTTCKCGWSAGYAEDWHALLQLHLADALMPLFAETARQARNEALEEAAKRVEAWADFATSSEARAFLSLANDLRALKTDGGNADG